MKNIIVASILFVLSVGGLLFTFNPVCSYPKEYVVRAKIATTDKYGVPQFLLYLTDKDNKSELYKSPSLMYYNSDLNRTIYLVKYKDYIKEFQYLMLILMFVSIMWAINHFIYRT